MSMSGSQDAELTVGVEASVPPAADTAAGTAGALGRRGPLHKVRRVGGALRRPRGRTRLLRPGGREHHRCLLVADVDLDHCTVTVQPAVTPLAAAAEGVHALVWFHGEPVGEVTVAGEPAEVLDALPTVAARELEQAVLEHLLRDALALPGGVATALERGLRAVPHPTTGAPDGSQVTVAVCTRDRPDDLRRCLTAIGRLSTPVAEVMVVDNASRDDRTRQVAEEFGVRYVREPRAGLDWARNRALLEAGTSVVAFTDDDVLVHPDWVRGLLRALQEEPDAVAVTGLVAPAELATAAQVLFEAQGGFGRGYARKWLAVDTRSGDVAAQLHAGTGGAGTGANMALRREPALALGGFDPALDVGTPTGGGGDLEMYFRVLAAGELLVYEPTAVVRHVHRQTMAQLVRQMRGHGTGSYSIFAGAGRHYGRVQAREFAIFGAWWLYRHHLRENVRSLLWPRAWPGELARAETRGMVDAVIGRYYRRAQEQAAEQSAQHPGEPGTPALVQAPATRRRPRTADPVVAVDLLRDELVVPRSAAPAPVTRPGRRVRVRVTRNGQPQLTFPVWTNGTRPSVVRLRAEVVAWLGPAVLAPGTSWAHLALASAAGSGSLTESLADAVAAGVAGHHASPDLTVSLLMATRDRPVALRRSLESVARHAAGRELQIVLVDNSPDPAGTRAAVQGMPGVEVVHEPRPGLSRARNAGLPALTGDVVVFVDDDVEITDGWLESLVAPFADPGVAAVTGNVLPADLTALEPQVFEDYGGLGRGAHRWVFAPAWLHASRGPAPTWHIGATANAAVRRRVLSELGPFDEALGAGRPAGVGEDTEYFYRILRAGWSIVYEPTAVVLHHHRGDRDALRRQLRAYSAGHIAYHLQILSRYGDLRGLVRIGVVLPRHYLRRAWWVLRGHDYPGDLLAAEVRGALAGVPAWARSRISSR